MGAMDGFAAPVSCCQRPQDKRRAATAVSPSVAAEGIRYDNG